MVNQSDAVEAALATSQNMFRSPRMFETAATSADAGAVRWSPVKSIWIGSMTAIAVLFGPATVSLPTLAVFLGLSAVTLCLGHSLGMHRRLIHRSFDCPLWVERLFVYLGTLVGMAGPYGMIRQHDIRDWAQRRGTCHPYLAHRTTMLTDYWWQLHCTIILDEPPDLVLEPRVANDRFYRFLEATWIAQQLPLAGFLYAIGGWDFVVWGIAVRVALSVTGHWFVGHIAHNRGARNWHVSGAGVQGYNVSYVSLLTMGESLHNNHHAYPGSARLAHRSGETDPGWWVLLGLERLGLACNIRTPECLPLRPALVDLAAAPLTPRASREPAPAARIR